MASDIERILVIRLGALGDLVFCFQSFHEIRQAHPHARIALLTRAPFASFARKLPWFDRVIVESHPTWRSPGDWLDLRNEISSFDPAVVYDLQGKKRQSILYALLGGPFGPAWSGAAPYCKFPRPWPPEKGSHFTDFLAAQLRIAGVRAMPAPDLAWLDAPTDKFALPERYAVIIPGCSPGAVYKRWPPDKYAALANTLNEKGIACVAVGTGTDSMAIAAIKNAAPAIIDLCGKTSLFELAGLFRRAVAVIGNDTGPLHIAASVGARTVALFSGRSNPTWSSPPGPRVALRQKKHLADMPLETALDALGELGVLKEP
ncbi:MAG: glycosyltransferase family 9 protein [Alphaproteobacteria bacterium]|nr:glycosyltransferase family 9 protein [Alphaproteobacteria bacterium]